VPDDAVVPLADDELEGSLLSRVAAAPGRVRFGGGASIAKIAARLDAPASARPAPPSFRGYASRGAALSEQYLDDAYAAAREAMYAFTASTMHAHFSTGARPRAASW